MGTPDRITKLIPQPRDVTLGGVVYPIQELRLSDLAQLQNWLDSEWEDPLDEVEARLLDSSLTSEQRDDLLFDAHARSEEGPPVDGSPAAAEWFATREGQVAFLLVVLQRNRKQTGALTREEVNEVAQIAATMTAPEYLRLRRVAYGVSSLKALTQKLMGYDEPGESTGTWSEAIDEVAKVTGWTYETIYSLTITEFVNARRNGKPVDDSVSKAIRPGQAERYAAYLERKYGAHAANGDGANGHGSESEGVTSHA